MNNNSINLGISNFKPFGEKLQKFSIKPITLIYGPNSIGKSSVIHSMAYIQNIYKDGNFNPIEMKFGDTISIGGYSQFVHKKDLSRNIIIEQNLNDEGSLNIEPCIDHFRTNDDGASFREMLLSLKVEDIKEEFSYMLHAMITLDDNTESIDEYILSEPLQWIYRAITVEPELSVKVKKNTSDWKKTPSIGLQTFLDKASTETKKIFQSTSSLYVYMENEDYTIFNELDFGKTVLEAGDEAIDSLCIDLINYIPSNFDDEKWPIVEDPTIKVRHTVGQSSKNIFTDIFSQYFVGNELLLEAKRINKKESDSEDEFEIHLNTKHWFVQRVISDIEKKGQWKSESETVDIYSLIDESIKYTFEDLETINTIFLDFKSKEELDLCPLMYWSPKYEKSLGGNIENLSQSYQDYNDDTDLYDEWDDTYEEAQLYRTIRVYNIENINDVLMRLFYSWIRSANNVLRDRQQDLQYIGPLRFLPERYEFSFSSKQSDIGDSESIWQHLKDSDEVKNQLNSWLSGEKLKTPYELQFQKHIQINEKVVKQLEEILKSNPEDALSMIEENVPYIKEMTFYDKRYDTPVNIREMGLGVSQVLPILVSLMQLKNKMIAVEQPELHLHPSVQSDLADEFIKSFKKNNNTVILETHSEHLLLRIMKRMRQTYEDSLENDDLALKPEDISLLYVDADENKTYITELRLDEDGSLLDPWPGGFFEEGLEERFF